MNQNDLENTTSQNQIDPNKTIVNMSPINPNMQTGNEQSNTISNQGTSPVPPTTVESPIPNGNNDSIDNEKLKKVEINYTPPSKFKIFLLIVFFVGLIGFVIFLPDISEYMDILMGNTEETKVEKITTGKMTCTLSSHTQNLNKDYEVVFSFTDNKLEKTVITTVTKGDISLDEETLDQLNNQCQLLSDSVKSLNGINVSCDYLNGQLTEKQSFTLNEINQEEMTAAYIEAGATNPEYQAGQDMDRIETNMNISQYECERTK